MSTPDFYADTLDPATQAIYRDGAHPDNRRHPAPLLDLPWAPWKPWMNVIRLRQARSLAEVDEFLRAGQGSDCLCWDIETRSLDPQPEKIVGHSLAYNGHEGLYIPVKHDVGAEYNLDQETVFRKVIDAIADKILVVYNYQFEGAFLTNAGVERPTTFDRLEDVMIVRWLYYSDDKKLDLKGSAKQYLHSEMLDIREVPGVALDVKKEGKIDFSKSHPCDATLYAAADVVMTMRLREKMRPYIAASGQEFVNDFEHELEGVLLRMASNPITFDRSVLEQGRHDLLRWADVLASRVYAMAGEVFNIGSSAQVARVLKRMGVKLELSDKGNYLTSDKAIGNLAVDYPAVQLILDWRSVIKEIGTYCDPLLENTSSDHPYGAFQIRQAGAPTGRFAGGKPSAGDPRFLPMNGQSIPAPDAYALAPCREVFNPPEEEMMAALHFGGAYAYDSADWSFQPDDEEEAELLDLIRTERLGADGKVRSRIFEDDGASPFAAAEDTP